MFNGLLSQAGMLPAAHASLHEHEASPEFPGQDGHRALAILLAIILALPAIGMISSGLTLDRLWLGLTGVGIFIGMGIFYAVIALLVLSALS